MSAANTQNSYGQVAKVFHWLTALLIITLLPLGLLADRAPLDTSEQLALKAQLFSIHKTLGLLTFFVALARITWALTQAKPGSLNPDRKLEHGAAETVHWLLYGSILLVPLTGWIHHAATTGFAPIWWPFGQSLPFVPKDEGVSAIFSGLHLVFILVLVGSLLLHIAGALKHHFVDQDDTLRRMTFSRTKPQEAAPHHAEALPPIVAIVIWFAAIGIGSTQNVYEKPATGPAQIALQEVASDWVVRDGEIALEITQFGNKVQGSFAEWTASISFDPDIPQGKAGSVDVTIAIPSLTLGSVTDQALGPDYFNAETHPTASFSAEIVTVADGYEALGALTLNGQKVPVTLPFSPTIEDNTAVMSSSVTLDRMAFGIGENMADESSLAFAVLVSIQVTATRDN